MKSKNQTVEAAAQESSIQIPNELFEVSRDILKNDDLIYHKGQILYTRSIDISEWADDLNGRNFIVYFADGGNQFMTIQERKKSVLKAKVFNANKVQSLNLDKIKSIHLITKVLIDCD